MLYLDVKNFLNWLSLYVLLTLWQQFGPYCIFTFLCLYFQSFNNLSIILFISIVYFYFLKYNRYFIYYLPLFSSSTCLIFQLLFLYLFFYLDILRPRQFWIETTAILIPKWSALRSRGTLMADDKWHCLFVVSYISSLMVICRQ